ncbi:MAG: PadR family transcriptional regulator [Promethearchaeota archaeon]
MNELEKWQASYRKGFIKPLILQILSKMETYPYQLTKQISQRSQGRLKIAPSNIYPLLSELEKIGFIIEKKVEREKRKRVFYSISPDGEIFLEKLRESMCDFLVNLLTNFENTGSDESNE